MRRDHASTSHSPNHGSNPEQPASHPPSLRTRHTLCNPPSSPPPLCSMHDAPNQPCPRTPRPMCATCAPMSQYVCPAPPRIAALRLFEPPAPPAACCALQPAAVRPCDPSAALAVAAPILSSGSVHPSPPSARGAHTALFSPLLPAPPCHLLVRPVRRSRDRVTRGSLSPLSASGQRKQHRCAERCCTEPNLQEALLRWSGHRAGCCARRAGLQDGAAARQPLSSCLAAAQDTGHASSKSFCSFRHLVNLLLQQSNGDSGAGQRGQPCCSTEAHLEGRRSTFPGLAAAAARQAGRQAAWARPRGVELAATPPQCTTSHLVPHQQHKAHRWGPLLVSFLPLPGQPPPGQPPPPPTHL